MAGALGKDLAVPIGRAATEVHKDPQLIGPHQEAEPAARIDRAATEIHQDLQLIGLLQRAEPAAPTRQ